MSTKNLARTVLERGRPNGDKFFRRYRHRRVRSAMRSYLRKATIDPEIYDEKIETCLKESYGPVLTDKLGPVYAWIDKQVGKPWSEVRRLIKEKFDIRTLAGYHIVDTHILGEIKNCGQQESLHEFSFHFYDYYVDENDILKESPPRKSRYEKYRKVTKEKRQEIIQWLDHRKIGFINGVLFWIKCHKPFLVNIGLDFHYSYVSLESKPSFYVQYRLDAEEVNYWRELPDWIKQRLLNS